MIRRPPPARPALWLILVATLLVSRPATAETGLLAVRGSSELAGELAAAVVKTLRGQHREVLGPDALVRRLASNAKVATALRAAREAIEEAEREALYMKKRRSAAAARRALVHLETIAARHHAGAVVGRAQLARGTAALLDPADRGEALAAFRAAFAADPDLRPNPDRVPTRTARLLQQARRTVPAPQPPTREELSVLAVLGGLGELLWVTVDAGPDALEVVALRYDHDQTTLVGPRRARLTLQPGEGNDKVASAVSGLFGYSPKAAAPRAESTPARATPAAVRLPPPRRTPQAASPAWYQRWWVWTIAAVVVAGSATAIGVMAGSRTERSYGFAFQLK